MRALWAQICVVVVFACCLACAITQEVEPVPATISQSVCIRENRAVRPIFLASYRESLEARGYQVRVVSGELPADCSITSTYDARWSWDMAMYMGYAEINVLHDDATIGRAIYDVHLSASTRRFVDPRRTIRELVAQLFPEKEVR